MLEMAVWLNGSALISVVWVAIKLLLSGTLLVVCKKLPK